LPRGRGRHGVFDFSPGVPAASLRRVPKWIKFIIALLLLPVCAGAAMALWKVLCASGSADTTWIPFLAGAACWMVLFVFLPKPLWIYVFGHELTHVLWTWLFGGRVKKMKVTSGGGHVVISKTNFVIALAPYFFPLYAFLVIAIFALGRRLWDWHDYLIYFHLVVGAAYAFHVTLTWHALQTRQTDITSQGHLFSAVIIFLGNAGILLLGIPLLTAKAGLLNALGWWLEDTGGVLNWLQKLL
jgi:peptidase M50B-like protein